MQKEQGVISDSEDSLDFQRQPIENSNNPFFEFSTQNSPFIPEADIEKCKADSLSEKEDNREEEQNSALSTPGFENLSPENKKVVEKERIIEEPLINERQPKNEYHLIFADNTNAAINFYESLVIETKTHELVMVGFDGEKLAPLGFTLNTLGEVILGTPAEMKETKDLINFFNKYFLIKKKYPKDFQIHLASTGHGCYSDFDAMINGYRLVTKSELSFNDLLDYNLFESSKFLARDPVSYIKWFLRTLVNSTFSLFFFDFILLFNRLQSLDYFSQEANQNIHNDKPLDFGKFLSKSISDIACSCIRYKQLLKEEKFILNLKKYNLGFFKFCDLFTKIGKPLLQLFSEHKYQIFFLDGFSGKMPLISILDKIQLGHD